MLQPVESAALPRLLFDSNERLAINVYDLSRDDLKAKLDELGDALQEGLRVVIVMPDELEMEAVLGFDRTWGGWYAVGDESTIKHYY